MWENSLVGFKMESVYISSKYNKKLTLTSRVIEEVIFKSCPTPLGKKQRSFPTDQMKTQDRIERIINDLFEFGVPIEVLFDVDDLMKAKNIPKVSFMINSVPYQDYKVVSVINAFFKSKFS